MIEAGGTKFVVAVARSRDEILRVERIPTTSPSTTLSQTIAFFQNAAAEFGAFDAAGIGCFGPVDLDPRSATWGCITSTPKPGWNGVNVAGAIGAALGCPVGFDTDVNGAALAEARWGASQGTSVSTYVTVGTGIGGGVVIEGQPLHGARHPEMGHVRPERHPRDHDFAGVCPFHGACLEGLASGPAIMARWGATLSDLPEDHEAHEIVAFYLGQLVVMQQAMLSPDRIVIGGGVLGAKRLLPRIRSAAAMLANGYFGVDRAGYDVLIRSPELGERSGLLGGLVLAETALLVKAPLIPV
ncbi:ROK family protein [Sphingomonas antarctica]|uniref:ROK family protein n=1 Tax=Sphingomonas antarctica TaxID=2040274 RepID=UPI0039EBB279